MSAWGDLRGTVMYACASGCVASSARCPARPPAQWRETTFLATLTPHDTPFPVQLAVAATATMRTGTGAQPRGILCGAIRVEGGGAANPRAPYLSHISTYSRSTQNRLRMAIAVLSCPLPLYPDCSTQTQRGETLAERDPRRLPSRSWDEGGETDLGEFLHVIERRLRGETCAVHDHPRCRLAVAGEERLEHTTPSADT